MTAALTHLDATGAANMVNVGEKPATGRLAVAAATLEMAEPTLAAIMEGTALKGDVLAAARLAGIMAAKKTAELIPLCHQLQLSQVQVRLTPCPGRGRLEIEATAKTTGPTGVEMEALTAAAVAALTVYDMAKALDRGMVIGELRLLKKDGGASGLFVRP